MRPFSYTWLTWLALGSLIPDMQAGETDKLDRILEELQQIRNILESTRSAADQPPQVVKLALDNERFMGSPDAALTIVMFTDFECGYCEQFHTQTFPDLKKHFIDVGTVRFYSIDLPLESHKHALSAAQAGRCADEQGQFWQMHDRMQATTEELNNTTLVKFMTELGVDVAAFRKCIDEDKYKEAVLQDAKRAVFSGVKGTPTFVVGKSTKGGVEGEVITGAMPFGVFERTLANVIQ